MHCVTKWYWLKIAPATMMPVQIMINRMGISDE